eukprot:CAMPEP_0204380652 /NCGR_PEP_ID=MMETSP0469-20131031/53542_1 /ASSEMBLY_ACC=CAM_ASM_000384 /TAXON_ID=2969 /ORGANISM="Oxyrrhis marina" /LENGTH=407 /DNA_ID=CAMNT_0051372325 /DNA_START=94 /DNA_END=1317 /DNA_ORIENTATION=+
MLMNCWIIKVYSGSYHSEYVPESAHYPGYIHIFVLTWLGRLHVALACLWVTFYMLAYSAWRMSTQVEEGAESDDENAIQALVASFWGRFVLFVTDQELQVVVAYVFASFLGAFSNFLWFAFHLLDVCRQSIILEKVILSITSTSDQLVGTMFLGIVVQYAFVSIGFLLFKEGYGFADMDTSSCQSMLECLVGHLDYGFRSAPVWGSWEEDWVMLLFDYAYNMFVILILVAIISGIIIDTFADMRASQQEKQEDMDNLCFICSQNRSDLERESVKFATHISQDHFMWVYARFLLYIEEEDDTLLTGLETYVKEKIVSKEITWFPIGRCIAQEAGDAEDVSDREVRIKDLDDMATQVSQAKESSAYVHGLEVDMKAQVKELREQITAALNKLGEVQKVLSDSTEAEVAG